MSTKTKQRPKTLRPQSAVLKALLSARPHEDPRIKR
jgi:hypothetical protein